MGIIKKNCRNCHRNPCTPSCALQSVPDPLHPEAGIKLTGGQRPDGGRQATPRQRRQDLEYQAIRDRQPRIKVARNLRYLTNDQARVVQQMQNAGAVKKMEHTGEYIKITLKPGFEDQYTEYDGHQ
jgi:hypothetical protein